MTLVRQSCESFSKTELWKFYIINSLRPQTVAVWELSWYWLEFSALNIAIYLLMPITNFQKNPFRTTIILYHKPHRHTITLHTTLWDADLSAGLPESDVLLTELWSLSESVLSSDNPSSIIQHGNNHHTYVTVENWNTCQQNQRLWGDFFLITSFFTYLHASFLFVKRLKILKGYFDARQVLFWKTKDAKKGKNMGNFFS